MLLDVKEKPFPEQLSQFIRICCRKGSRSWSLSLSRGQHVISSRRQLYQLEQEQQNTQGCFGAYKSFFFFGTVGKKGRSFLKASQVISAKSGNDYDSSQPSNFKTGYAFSDSNFHFSSLLVSFAQELTFSLSRSRECANVQVCWLLRFT